MNKIKFSDGRKSKEIIIDKIKYIAVERNSDFWFYYQCLKCSQDKISKSEYGEDNNIEYSCLIDGEPLSKTDEIFFVNHHFELDDDLKLGSKSLAARYLSSIFQEKMFSDEVLQAQSAIELLASFLVQENIAFDANVITNKLIAKIVTPVLLKDSLRSNSSDLSYEELIEYQLDMINRSHDVTKREFVLVELICLTPKLKQFIESLNNLKVIVVFSKHNIDTFSNNIVIDGIDLENDEVIYERMMNMSNYYDLNDYKEHLKNEILNK